MVQLALLSLAALVLSGQAVRVTLTDGTVVEGRLEGYEDGRYRLRVGDAVRRVAEAEVLDVVLTGRPLPEPAAPPGEAARAALARGRLEQALREAGAGLEARDREARALEEVFLEAFAARAARLLEEGDADGMAETFAGLPASLGPQRRRELAERLAPLLGDPAAAAGATGSALAEGVAGLADPERIEPERRAALAERLADLAAREVDGRRPARAEALYRAALRLDAGEGTRRRIAEALHARLRRHLEEDDPGEAVALGRLLEALAPEDPLARRSLQEAEFALLRRDAQASFSDEAAEALRRFLAGPRPAEHREWAARELARLGPAAAGPDIEISRELRRYFPLKPGRTLLYERADGLLRQKVRVDAVVREGDVLRVHFTLRELYKDFATSRVHALEVERDAVVLTTGRNREVLLRAPFRAGDAWSWTSDSQEFRRTIVAVGQTVEAGPPDRRRRYEDCVIVEFTSRVERHGEPALLTSRSVYAPDVGLVRLEFLDPEHRKYGLELVEVGTE